MISSAEKTSKPSAAVQQKTAGASFFRKAGGEGFFAAKENTSFFGKPLQAKLTVSTPDDPHEKEADAVADKVMRMQEPAMSSTQADHKEENLQRKEEEEVHAKQEAPVINSIQCKEEPEQKLYTKADTVIHRSGEEQVDAKQERIALNSADNTLDRKNISLYRSDIMRQSGRGPPATSIPFAQTLASSKGGGSALPGDTKQFMESRFNADFSGVRIHTDITANHLSRSINAQAFAHGNDIYFGSGKFAPNSSAGGTLLAHELTHTIQQGASKSNPSTVNRKNSLYRKNSHPRNVDNSAFSSIYNSVASKKEDTVQAQNHVQSKSGISNLTVDSSGKLNTGNVTVSPKAENKLQAKEDDKTDEEKNRSSHQPILQKKAEQAILAKCECCQETAPAIQPKFLQPQTQYATANPAINTITPGSETIIAQDRGPPSVSVTRDQTINRSPVDDAMAYAGSVTDCISLSLNTAISCAKGKAQQVALHIPGYKALRVVLGEDPITGEGVAFNGRNFIEAALDIMPGGNLLRQKLDEIHQLDAAAKWIDEKIDTVKGMVKGLTGAIKNFWDRLELADLSSPLEVLKKGANIILGFVGKVIDFAVSAAKELLKMVKDFLLDKIVDFIKAETTAYPLLTVILGKDPITEKHVERNGTTILNALLDLGGEEGRQQKKKMDETGTFKKAAGYIDEGIKVFATAYDELSAAFTGIWKEVTIENLMDPIGTFKRIYGNFAAPILKVWDFIKKVGAEILKFVKEVMMKALAAWAKTVKGYPLVTVIIGEDPFTHEAVPPTVENLIHGFMSLMDGGEEQFKQMKESGAVAKADQKIKAAVKKLNMTPQYVMQLFTDLWNSFSITDLLDPIGAFKRIIARFGEPIGRLIAFVVEIVKIVVEVLLTIMQFPFDVVNNIIAKAMQAFEKIKADPIGFLKNLLRAIKEGFIQFFDNILKHLLAGLTGWLMSELKDANVAAPKDFSLKTIIGWVLDLLGITMEKIWDKLAKHPKIGPERVAKMRGMIGKLEGIWTFIKDVQERGMAAIWDKIAEKLSDLWNTVLDMIKNWIMEQIIGKIVTKLLSMLDPTGIMAVVNSVIALYKAIQSFIKYLKQMLEIVNSFVEGVAEIANGNTKKAANFLESTLARGVPIVIGFLANQVGLSGVGKKVGEMIEKVRDLVDKALTWLVNKAVDTGFALFDKLMGKGGGDNKEADTRTMEEKQADVNKGKLDAEALLETSDLGIEQIKQKLPAIKTKYRLTKIELVSGENNQVHVDVEINPKASTKNKQLGPFLIKEGDIITFKRGEGKSFAKVLQVRLETSDFDYITIGYKSNTTVKGRKLAEEGSSWWRSNEEALELPKNVLEAENAKEDWGSSYATARSVLNWRRSGQQRNRDASKQWEHVIEFSTKRNGINSSKNLAWTDADFNQRLNVELGRPRQKEIVVNGMTQWVSWRQYLDQVDSDQAHREFKEKLYAIEGYSLKPNTVSSDNNPYGYWQELSK